MITTGVRYKHGGNPVDCGDNYVCQEVAAECDECYEYRTERDVVGYLYLYTLLVLLVSERPLLLHNILYHSKCYYYNDRFTASSFVKLKRFSNLLKGILLIRNWIQTEPEL